LVSSNDSVTSKHVSYDPELYNSLARAEDDHFWFRARNTMIKTLILDLVSKLPAGYAVLEVGCGTGNVLRMLEEVCDDGTVIGIDLFGEGFAVARQRTSCALIQADMTRPPFSVMFDVIGLFDVLEHLADDRNALGAIHDMLKESGVLLITVPAHPSLWSYFDELGHHCRRYTEKELANKLTGAGFTVEYMTQFMVSIFPIVWLARRLTARKSAPEKTEKKDEMRLFINELRIRPGLNGLLRFLLEQEAHFISRHKRLPIGTSLIALAKKKVHSA